MRDPNYTVIRISRENYEKLRQMGHTPESFDDIISKILAENRNLVEETNGD
jgi:predicted CopG family antitoxin